MEPEKLFTINEVAVLTSLTTRTLRNHLKDGKLHGHKVGGQWRFRMSDIEDFTLGSGKRPRILTEGDSQVDDFLCSTDKSGTQVCTIVDIVADEDKATAKEFLIRDLMNWYDNRSSMKYTYEYKNGMARFVIVASPELMISALDLLS